MDLDTEIDVTRVQFYGDTNFYQGTRDQIVKLIILFKEAGILDRDLRIRMLREWTGLAGLKSSNELSLHVASRMIHHLCDGEGNLTFDGLAFLTYLSFRA